MSSKSIKRWCDDRDLSRGMFYILDRQGKAPRTMKIGRRRLITDEADATWERERQAESAATEAAVV